MNKQQFNYARKMLGDQAAERSADTQILVEAILLLAEVINDGLQPKVMRCSHDPHAPNPVGDRTARGVFKFFE